VSGAALTGLIGCVSPAATGRIGWVAAVWPSPALSGCDGANAEPVVMSGARWMDGGAASARCTAASSASVGCAAAELRSPAGCASTFAGAAAR
jgi:hypothetical protein